MKKRLLKLPKKGGRKKERGGLLLPPSLQLLLASVKHALFDEKKEKGPLPICTFFSFFMRRISAERRTVGWRGGGKNQWWPQSSRQRRWDLVRGFMARWASSPSPSRVRTQNPKTKSPRFDKSWAHFFEETCWLSIFSSSRGKKGICLS